MHLVFESVVDLPREALFRWHAQVAHLAILMAGTPGFEVIEHPGQLRIGAKTRALQRWLGLPIVMTFVHSRVDPPASFSEELEHGPFQRFSHRHVFVAEGERTRLYDELVVELPWWLGEEAAMRRVVAPRLATTFRDRHARLAQLVADATDRLCRRA